MIGGHYPPRLIAAAAALHDRRLDVAEPLLRQHLKEDPFDVAAIRMLAELAGRISDIRTAIYETGTGNIINPAAQLGRLKQYTTGDAALGIDFSKYSIELFVQNFWDERAELSRFSECGSCGQRPYIVPITPRTIGLRLGAKF